MAFDPDAYLKGGTSSTSDFDPDAYLGIAPPQSSMQDVAKEAAKTALESSPVKLTQKLFETDPATMQRVGGAALPITLGMLGGAPGAAAGEFLRQATGTALAPDTVPKTPLGRFASVVGSGVAQDPKILNAIPGISNVTEMASNLYSKMGRGGAKIAQAMSGGKAGDFLETTKKGAETYAAPSLPEAQAEFGQALAKLPGKNIAPTISEQITSAITPESSAGNKFLVDMGKKLDAGELIDARQALKAKQSLDAVIDTVPGWQEKRRGDLFALKNTFDDVLSNQSGAMKEASNTYRAAILKNNMTKFLPVNKHGDYSRLAPMLSGLASTLGGTVGGLEGGKKAGLLGAAAPLAYMVGASPGSFGLGAAGIGELNALGQNPAVRQVLMQALSKIMQSKDGSNVPQNE